MGRKLFILMLLSFIAAVLDGFSIILLFPLVEVVFNFSLSNNDDTLIGEFLSYLKEVDAYFLIFFIVAMFILKAIFTFMVGIFISRITASILYETISNNIQAYSYLKLEFISKMEKGRVNSVITQIDGFVEAFGQFLKLTSQFAFALIYVSISFYINLEIGFIIGLMGLVIIGLYRKLNNEVDQSSYLYAKAKNRVSNSIHDFSVGLSYLRSTGKEKKITDLISKNAIKLKDSRRTLLILRYLSSAIREPVAILVLFIVLFINSLLNDDGAAAALMSLAILYRAIQSILTMQASWQALSENHGNIELLNQGLNELKFNKENSKGIIKLTEAPVHIKALNLTFCFDDKKNLFSNLNFEVCPNDIALIKGKSGTGKSTLISLLMGQRNKYDGNIYINSNNLHDISLKNYRNLIGYVSQDGFIFDGTIMQNVCFDFEKSNFNEDELIKIKNCLSIAGFDICNTELNLNSILGSNGLNLSGGQKQRLCLARELYKSPNLLILDEPTSGLDCENLNLIVGAIKKLKDSMTIIIISHQEEYSSVSDVLIDLDVVASTTFEK